jgi:2-haloacid dehalogenase
LFIDDNLRNVQAASDMGIQTIHFKNPKDLKLNLEAKTIRL